MFILWRACLLYTSSAGLQGIKDFILEVVETAGPNPCPPMVVGVGIGGTFDKCALLAKKALMRPLAVSYTHLLRDFPMEKLRKTLYLYSVWEAAALMKEERATVPRSAVCTLQNMQC